jgi:hypothetical protein
VLSQGLLSGAKGPGIIHDIYRLTRATHVQPFPSAMTRHPSRRALGISANSATQPRVAHHGELVIQPAGEWQLGQRRGPRRWRKDVQRTLDSNRVTAISHDAAPLSAPQRAAPQLLRCWVFRDGGVAPGPTQVPPNAANQ